VLYDTSIFGLAVLAIATVEQAITEAIAKTANISKPNFQQSQSTSVFFDVAGVARLRELPEDLQSGDSSHRKTSDG